MEIVNSKTLRDLEYPKVKEHVKRHCSSTLGQREIDELTPTTDLERITRELGLVQEMKNALQELPLRIGPMEELEPILKHAREVTALSNEEFVSILKTISSGRELSEAIRELQGEFPQLKRLAERIHIFPELEGMIRRTFDEEGEMREDASPLLRKLNKQKRIHEERVESRLRTFLNGAHYAKMIQEHVITRRSSRLVIPIKSGYKTEIDCVVHDSSDSGQTLYVEPKAVVEENNKVRELEAEIRDERIRVLRALTEKVQQESKHIRETLKALARIDGVYGRARYAIDMHCISPKINTTGRLSLKQARHPLIDPAVVVPIDLSFGEKYQGILITGPNTGGKTVTLKTVGLLALMAQSGIPIPAMQESELPIYEKIRSDIGDEQSIQQNLSTFSSHMKNIVGILNEVGEKSLVLVDEIGAGTDPQEGAALGMSIIRALLKRNVNLIVTTHFSALKHFAYQHELLKTCSVEFNVETLQPTYRLFEGVGASNAFIIAQRLGLREEIIDGAESDMAEGAIKTEEIIRMLEKDRQLVASERERVTRELRDAIAERQRFEHRVKELEQGKEKHLRAEVRELEMTLRETRKQLEQALHQARRGSSEVEIKQTLAQMEQAEEKFEQATERAKSREREPLSIEQIELGKAVYVLPLSKVARVREILDDNLLEIDVNGLRIKTKLSELRSLSSDDVADSCPQPEPPKSRRQEYSPHDYSPTSPGIELQVRGMKVVDALLEVDRYLDRLVLNGMDKAFIVHGKGTGVLRREIREKLRHDRRVKNYYSALAEEGGEGITIVEL